MTMPAPGPRARDLRATSHDSAPERVLLATDGGLAGVAAIRWLADRSTRHPMHVEIVHVVPVLDDRVDERSDPTTLAAEGSVQQAKELLERLAPGTTVHPAVVHGEPIPALQRRAEDSDLLVVGTRRTAHGTPHFTASFATRLAEAGSRPTVVVPRGWERSDGAVVVGVEDDGSDTAAIEFAAAEAEVLGRDLVLVHAWRLAAVVSRPITLDLDRQALEVEASARLSDVVGRVRRAHPALRVAPVFGHGEAVHSLVVAGKGAALVVVGTHGLGVIDRLLLRSVSRAVLERPSCPIAVVPMRA
ncbi:MAG: universal stress protein [Acidobacteria bacterium]|nr:universal stress protein [Acidobacteriota bacterium]